MKYVNSYLVIILIKNEICQRILEVPIAQFSIVGRDKESSSGQIKTNIGPIEIQVTNYNRVRVSVIRWKQGKCEESESFTVDSAYERQLSELVKKVCDVDQEAALKRIWSHVN